MPDSENGQMLVYRGQANMQAQRKNNAQMKVFGQGKIKTQGTGAATQGTQHNADWSGKE